MVVERDLKIININKKLTKATQAFSGSSQPPKRDWDSDHIDNLKDKLERANQEVANLKKEIIAYQKIQYEQGKALTKLEGEKGYQKETKAVFEQLRVEKEKVNKLKEQNRILQKSNLTQQNRMVKLETSIREFKALS